MEREEEVIKLLKEAHNQYNSGQTEQCFSSIARAIEIAQESGNTSLQVRALNELGFFQYREGKIAEALATFEQAIEKCSGKEETGFLPYILNNYALCFAFLGEYNKAEEILGKAISLGEKTIFFLSLGRVKLIQGKLEEALENYEKALEVCSEQEDVKRIFLEFYNALVPYFLQEEFFEEAATVLGKLLEICHKFNFWPADEWEMLNNYASILASCGEYDQAIEKYTEALKICPDLEGKVSILRCLGDLHLMNGSIENAMNSYYEALNILVELPTSAEHEILTSRILAIYALSDMNPAD